MCDHVRCDGGQLPHLHLPMRSLIAFAVRWVVLGSSAWLACLILFARLHPAVGVAVMLACALGYVTDARHLTRAAAKRKCPEDSKGDREIYIVRAPH